MLPIQDGSLRLFRFAGIQVSLHWSWFLVAVYVIATRAHRYSSLAWNLAEYLALFLIVLLHEFGHALACRQTGGRADRIVLWPLGGVAFVDPPPRAGAHLWSLVAGPLVNVILVPVFVGLELAAGYLGLRESHPDLAAFLFDIQRINLVLLIFNLFPIYPLDGGQILRSLLWFGLGPVNSLLVATVVGFLGLAGLIGLAAWWQSLWIGLMAFFLFTSCLAAFNQARSLRARGIR